MRKIVLTGGGTGGHFYPLMAVAEEIYAIAEEEKMLEPKLYYIGPSVLDKQALLEQNIIFKQSPAGKMRKYFDIKNFSDMVKTAIGVIKATFQLFFIYPDVVFSKGGYAAFPTTMAARILNIPVIIHESDAKPGKANLWASKFARAIAVSYPGVADKFPVRDKKKFALTGHPVRKLLMQPQKGEAAYKYLNLSSEIPTIFVFTGSLGAQAINKVILNALPTLIKKYQIIHQTGKDNIDDVKAVSSVILENNPHKDRYLPFAFLNSRAIRMVAGVSQLVIMRAGTGTISEVAAWGLPAIVIPIPEEISHDQTANAFTYARTGAAVAIKQKNLTEHILLSEIERILSSQEIQDEMRKSAEEFARPDAARKLARVIWDIVLEHED